MAEQAGLAVEPTAAAGEPPERHRAAQSESSRRSERAVPASGGRGRLGDLHAGVGNARVAALMSAGPLVDPIIVDHGAVLARGQIDRNSFMALLGKEVTDLATRELLAVGRSAEDCPYLLYWLGFYREQPAAKIERALRVYARPIEKSVDGYVDAVCSRVRAAIRIWATTGRITGVPGALVQAKGDPETAAIARSKDPTALKWRLGAGVAIDGRARSRLEDAFGVSLDYVRVHTDEAAARATAAAQARALTVGGDIAFAPGQFRPGTVEGDLLLAHEVAHSVQQAGGAPSVSPATPRATAGSGGDTELERDADRAAVAAVGRQPGALRALDGAPLSTAERAALKQLAAAPARPRPAGGLRLQRCGSTAAPTVPPAPTSETETDGGAPPTPGTTPGAPAVPAAPQAALAATPADLEKLPLLPTAGMRPITDQNASLLILGQGAGGGRQIFVVPARGLVAEVPVPAPEAAPGGASPAQRGPLAWMTAVGHASAVVVRTGPGIGMLVDSAGTRTGGPINVVIPPALEALSLRFGIARIDNVLLAHTHADHVSGLGQLTRIGATSAGGQVLVYPGLETTTVGPLGGALQSLPAGWTVGTVNVQQVTGPTGAQVTTGRLVIGEATLEMATDTATLRAYITALAAGRVQEASRLADAASMLTRIVPRPGGPEMVKVGDMRGRDIEILYEGMGDTAFRAMFGRARLVEGLHHLGAVRATDVRGLEILLDVVGGSAGEPFTVVAQTGPDKEINERLIRAIQLAGGRVIAVGEPDVARQGNIVVRSGGQVVQTGGTEWGVDPVTAQARTRADQLERAIRVLETLPDYRSGEASRADIIAGLRAEAQRLRTLLRARTRIGLSNLGPARTRNANFEQDLAQSTLEAQRVGGMEKDLGSERIEQLARTNTEITELQKEVLAARQKGEASEQLFELMSKVDPQIAKEMLLEAMGRPMSRNQQRSAWRSLQTRLRSQARTEMATQLTNPPPAQAKAAAWLGLALEAWELAEPFIQSSVQASRDQKREDFYLFFRDLKWWTEKGFIPYTTGRTADDEPDLGEDLLAPGIWKRVLEDLPDDERKKREQALSDKSAELKKAVDQAKALKLLYIPEMNRWPKERLEAFWSGLVLWTSAHIRNYDDYASELLETPTMPLRQAPDDAKSFGERKWQMRVGIVAGGHVAETWQDSADLTRIMNATARRMIETTKRERDEHWEKRLEDVPPPSQGPAVRSESAPLQEHPTAQAHFKGNPQPIFTLLNAEPTKVYDFHFWNESPRFFVYARAETPKGYAWVTGADYNTYAALRSATVGRLVQKVPIPIKPKETWIGSPDFDKNFQPAEYMNATELVAWTRYTNQEPLVFFHDELARRGYRGDIWIYDMQPNDGGFALVEVDKLVRDDK